MISYHLILTLMHKKDIQLSLKKEILPFFPMQTNGRPSKKIDRMEKK